MTINYASVTADKHTGTTIGRMYMERSPAITPLASRAYAEFAVEVRRQFKALPIAVEFVDGEPYQVHEYERMFDDIRNGCLRVNKTTPDQGHPLLSDDENNMFRAVHDYHGHFCTGRGFDRNGEEAAWIRHSRMFRGLARRAMTTETRGQSSALVWVNNGVFPPQKAILLPEWVSEIPRQFGI